MKRLSSSVFQVTLALMLTVGLSQQLQAQQSYTFTNASATGSAGPTQAMINTAYATTNLNGSVTILTQGIQQFTVPVSGFYRVTARGGQGYGSFGGRGASIAGDFSLTAGQVLRILVGQQGGVPLNSVNQYGGGGGSFVTYTNNAPLVVAGGGGGSWATSFQANSDGTVSTNGNAGLNGTAGNGTGGTGGGGGATASSADAGAGITGNGGGTAGGLAYVNGGNGGSNRGQGGFGGGGGTSSWDNRRSGGGGGYSGGGASAGTTSGNPQGGGGGSFNGGTNQTNQSGVNLGHGRVIITELCNINITAIGTTSLNRICAGNSVTLTTNAVSNYSWTNGANTSSIVVTPTAGTNYGLVATSSLACTTSANFSVGVDPALPTLTVVNTASANGGVCPNATVALTASGATSYSWTGSVINAVAFSPAASGIYTVTGTNACGSTTAAASVSIHPLPNVSGVASQPTICSGNPVSISGVGNAVSYSVVNAGVPHASNFFPATTAQYTLVGTSALSCTNNAVVGVTVVTTPVNPPLATPPLICIGNSATLTSSGATTYSWISTNSVVSGSSIVVSPSGNTTYTLTKSNANCVNSQTIQLFVNQLPSPFAIVTPTLICASRPATLQAGGAQSYTWSTAGPPVFTVTGASPVVSPSVTTLYTVAASDGTCINTTTVLLTANPNPTLSITPSSTNICQGDAVTLNVSGAIGYSWTTGAITSNSTAASISESPTVSTNYQVTGINNFNCTTNAQQVIVVRTTPTLQISTTKPLVCIGAPSSLTVAAQAGPCTYTWDANATTATGAVAVVNPLSTTVYTVIGRATNNCTAMANFQVAVFEPTFAVNTPTSSCLGGTINLIASGANTYTWNGNQPFSQISVSPSTATFYIVAATSSSNNVNCVSTNTVFVTIYSNPTVTAVPSRTQICRGEFTEINAGGALTYTLNTGLSGSVIPVNPTSNTIYTLTGTDQNGCISSTTVQVRTSICFGINELSGLSQVKVYPNPNAGNFTIKADRDMQLQLINELGSAIKVINITNASTTVQVEDLANGIYFLQDVDFPSAMPVKIIISR